MEITVQPKELAAGKLTDAHVEQAIKAIRVDGYVILENVVSHEHLDILRERMDADSQILINAERWGGAGGLKGHLQQGPPPYAPYIFTDIVANPYVVQVTQELLGPGLYNNFYNGNTNCPGSTTQPLHRDGAHLWPDQKVAHPTTEVVVNISPQETTEENGSVEIWPGSHLEVGEHHIDEEQEEARRKICPPTRGNAKKGSVLIRDMRLWHRGVPNPSDKPRHMIALIYRVHWLKSNRRLKYKTGCEAAFENSDLDHNAEFIDFADQKIGDYDYLFNPRF
ncbi:phytanoyl-CoA dioxygenase family protein [Candidatus Poribacteria bacterium]|nr:phytanoyl-CoA dioxygenase family protein [Candidatus Poribacteria bacterium]MYH83418.1 phytanoyl-CoA dioxygenase family protein [Candidatus Poribacteria bacterium]MYK95039.1 phytanoyl-CoA dioxygenase family protein [Candidatus Poribacteria bacterium]